MFRIWHPLRDPHHCTYRVIALLLTAPNRRLSLARLSILDAFLLFPQYLYKLSYSGIGELRSELRRLDFPTDKDSYVNLPDIRSVYRELQTFQRTAFSQLVAKNLIDKDAYSQGNALLIRDSIPKPLLDDIEQFRAQNEHQLDFLVSRIGNLPLDGAGGLYRRANLELGGRFR